MATRLFWNDHYNPAGSSYETWGGGRAHSLQYHTISHRFDNDPPGYRVLWSGTQIGVADTLEKAKKLAAADQKKRDQQSLLRRVW